MPPQCSQEVGPVAVEPPDTDRPPVNLAVVCPGLTPSTHMRLLSPLAWLEAQRLVTFTLIAEDELQSSPAELARVVLRRDSSRRKARLRAEMVLRGVQIVILQRSTSPIGERVRALARAAGAGVIYDCDDNFLAIDPDTPEVGAYYSSQSVRLRFVKMLAGADVVTTSTGVLADAFNEFAADVRAFPGCFDFAHIDRRPRPRSTSAVVIGYAGTVIHGPDFNFVEPALRRVLEEGRGAVRLQFFGFVPDKLIGLPGVDFVPFDNDYPGFLRTLSKVDWSFGIAPVADIPSRHFKSDNKYREYGACRIPAIFSDCTAYRRSVIDGETGLLVPHTEDGWYEGLKHLIADAALRDRLARAAYDDVAQRYSVTATAQKWLDTFQEVLSRTRR
jgi:glycosyltransferase involved in cell wall biosynthesis